MKLPNRVAMLLAIATTAGAINQVDAVEYSSVSGTPSPFLAAYLLIKSALAAEQANAKSIEILAPAKDAVLKSKALNKLIFDLRLSSAGNHVQIFIDEMKLAVDHDVNHCPCRVSLPKLAPGKHTITLKEATASQALTGVQGSVTVAVK